MPQPRQLRPTLPGIVLGTAGAVLLAVFGTVVGALALPNDHLRGTSRAWWFEVHCSHATALAWFYLGLGLLAAGWLLLAPAARAGALGLRACWAALVAWGAPLVLGPPLFSRDLYSYVAQGLIARAGHNPTSTSPLTLGHDPVLAGIASVWRSTPAPYGPLAALSTEATAHLGGRSLFTQVMAARLPAIVGMVLLGLLVPRLARHLGTDPGLATWLGVLSPLFVISFLAAGHNDSLMLGAMVAAALAVVGGRWLLGVGLATAAATVKAPALAVVGVPLVQRLWRQRTGRLALVASSALVAVATAVALSLLATFGFGWLSPSALAIPTHLRTCITPSVLLGTFVASILHGLGSHVATRHVVDAARDLVSVATVSVIAWLLVEVRRRQWVRIAGAALLVLAVGSPTMWPWYLTWGLVLLAATTAQRSRALAVVASLPVLLVGAEGAPALRGHAYLWAVPLLVAGLAWLLWPPRPMSLLGPRVD
jgi:hypothetical protein